MALSQKHSGKMLVPWFNTNEWKYVYNLIYDETSTKASMLSALQLIQMWKIRTPRLPSGVEGTLIILDALLQDERIISEQNLRGLYGAAIMRFLNLCGASGDKQGTFYKTAKQNNIPDWLIDLRHNVAHHQIFPSKYMLEMGLNFCLDWLKHEYWEKQAICLTDYVISVERDKRIEIMVELYCQINLIQYFNRSKNLIKSIELDDPIIMEKFEAIKDIAQIDLTMNTNDVLTLLFENLSGYISSSNTKPSIISEVIIENGSMFSEEIFKDDNEQTIPSDFVNIWEDLLNLLYKKNILISFIKMLVNIINSDTSEQTKKNIASFWLTEIFKGLVLTKTIYDKYQKFSSKGQLEKDTAIIILKGIIQDENAEFKRALNFDSNYYQNIQHAIQTVVLEIIEKPNTFILKSIEYISQLGGLSESCVNDIKLYVHAKPTHEITIEDRPHLLDNSIRVISSNTEILKDVLGENMPILENTNKPQVTKNNTGDIFVRVKDTSKFEGCPLGICKGQDTNTNPLLIFQ